MGEVLNCAPLNLTPGELLVLVALAEDARDRDRLAEHSDVESLTFRTRLKPGTIRNALSELGRRGLAVPQRRTTYRGGSGHQDYYVPKLEPHHRTMNGDHP